MKLGASTRRVGLAVGLTVASSPALTPSIARADDATPPDEPRADQGAGNRGIDRAWVYLDDARVAAPGAFVGTTNASYTSVSNSPSRLVGPFPGCAAPCNRYNAFAANTAVPGATVAAGGEVGLLPRLSVAAVGQLGLGGSDSAGTSAGAIVGLRLQLLPSEWRRVHLVASGGYLREAWQGPVYDGETSTWSGGSPRGDDGAWAQLSLSVDFERLRLATTLHAEHVFSDGRNPVDVMVQAGASYRVVGAFRAGIEYVGQDVEESFAFAADGGSRHFVGPAASLQLLRNRLTLVAGPAVGLTARSPDFVGRLGVSYAF